MSVQDQAAREGEEEEDEGEAEKEEEKEKGGGRKKEEEQKGGGNTSSPVWREILLSAPGKISSRITMRKSDVLVMERSPWRDE